MRRLHSHDQMRITIIKKYHKMLLLLHQRHWPLKINLECRFDEKEMMPYWIEEQFWPDKLIKSRVNNNHYFMIHTFKIIVDFIHWCIGASCQ